MNLEYCPDCNCELVYMPNTENYFCEECDTVFELCPDCGDVTYDDEWDYGTKTCMYCSGHGIDDHDSGIIIIPLNDNGFKTLEDILGE